MVSPAMIPSGVFFRAVDPKQFQTLFTTWAKQWKINKKTSEHNATLAIDGKTSRGSAERGSSALHLVSAYSVDQHLVFGEVAVDKKSNEITAIPELLNALDLTDTIVTIDAMGCQHAIAQQIIDKKGDYLLSLKGNQGNLHEDVVTWFTSPVKGVAQDIYQQVNKGHGRIESREVTVCQQIDWLQERHPQWPDLHSMIKVSSQRQVGDKKSQENRYYISSSKLDAKQMAQTIRQHWGIENQLHWVLDVSFGEDLSRIRKGHAAHNMAVIRHAVINAVNLVREKQTKKRSIKQSLKLTGWNQDALAKIIDVFF